MIPFNNFMFHWEVLEDMAGRRRRKRDKYLHDKIRLKDKARCKADTRYPEVDGFCTCPVCKAIERKEKENE